MLPLRASIAYTLPLSEPKNTLPPSTSGEDSVRLDTSRAQRTAPWAAVSATIRPPPPPRRASTVAYTIPFTTAGQAADSSPRRRLQKVWPLRLFIADSTPLSLSWKMLSPSSTGGNSSRAPPLLTHSCRKGGRRCGPAGKKRVWFFVYPYSGQEKRSGTLAGSVGVDWGMKRALGW